MLLTSEDIYLGGQAVYAPNGLKVVRRRKPRGGMEGDFETDSMRYKRTARWAEGFTDLLCTWVPQSPDTLEE